MQAVLDNWEAVCRRELRIPAEPLPWIIFYDEDRAWHLQAKKRLLPTHEGSTHSLRFTGKAYPLVRVAHQNGKVWVPDREPLPVDVAKPRVAAMPYDNERNSFFIAPLPGLFHKLAGPDMEGLAMWVQYPDGAGAGAVGRGLAEDVHHALGEA